MTTSAPAASTVSPPKQPELKFGPFAGGLSVAIWRNTVETDDGPREIRSLTINPRRYKDPQTGEWKNGSYRGSDVATLVLALESALQFMRSHPLSQPAEEEPPAAHEGQEWRIAAGGGLRRFGRGVVDFKRRRREFDFGLRGFILSVCRQHGKRQSANDDEYLPSGGKAVHHRSRPCEAISMLVDQIEL